ncbi:DUF4232 domain-containing protein [Streptomyces sp. NPDC002055]|uniref:DUF4232 domain-containing protein n=1 Tax=Streptomyces sp. NPDC002055 TaxID=3154534 RepID=UPI00332F2937
MRKNLVRATTMAAVAVTAALSLSACGGETDSADASSSPGASQSADQGQEADGGSGGSAEDSGSTSTSAGAGSGSSTGGSASGKSGGSADGGSGGGGKAGYGQACGTNDLTWSARSESQAGGYILISVKAKAGITCMLPGVHPVVAFGSDGTEAGPAEQAVGEQVKLSGATTAYAGVNPKTTNTDDGKELNEIITSVSKDDRTDPVSLTTGSITVDRPIVTNWHTVPQDAVPGTGLDSD